MLSMFMAGGFVMFPVLAVGALAVAAGACHALAPASAWRQTAASLRTAVLCAAAAGVAVDLGAVAAHVPELAANGGEASMLALVGVGEAMSPAVLGAVLATLGALLTAAGDVRQP